jgi:hypothetical protein
VESVDKIPSEASSIRAANVEEGGSAEPVDSTPDQKVVDATDEWQAGASVVRAEPEVTSEDQLTSKPATPPGSTASNVKMYAAMALIVLGSLISVVAGIWYIVACFQESIWWGLGGLFVPFVQLVFLFVHWDRAKAPFLLGLAASLMVIGAMFLSPEFAALLYDY